MVVTIGKGLAVLMLCLVFSIAPASANAVVTAGLPGGAYTQLNYYTTATAQSGFNGGTWNYGNFGTAWVQANTGALYTFDEARWTVNENPNGYSTAAVYVSSAPIGGGYTLLTPLVSQAGNTVTGQLMDYTFTPTVGQYIEFVFYGGNSWTAASSIQGLVLVPEPTPVALYIGLLLTAVLLAARGYRNVDDTATSQQITG